MELATDAKTIRATGSRPKTITELTLGLDWGQVFPWAIQPGITVHRRTYKDLLPFVSEHYQAINSIDPEDTRFCFLESTPQKAAFYDSAIDLFSFQDGSSGTVGVFAGQLTDWSTYYIRNISLLPDYQGKGVFWAFLKRFCRLLIEHSIVRMECDTYATNRRAMGFYLKSGFIPTGTLNSERWGSLLRFTKFLDESNSAAFQRQFIANQKIQLGVHNTDQTQN